MARMNETRNKPEKIKILRTRKKTFFSLNHCAALVNVFFSESPEINNNRLRLHP